MPSVMGLLEERERAARQRVEALQTELREAEAAWERFMIARETVGLVPAESRGGNEVPPVVAAGDFSGRRLNVHYPMDSAAASCDDPWCEISETFHPRH